MSSLIKLSSILLLLLFLIAAIFFMPVHWDEGWNLCVARTWLEHNHFGCFYNGTLTTSRLATGILPVSFQKIAFELFGISYIYSRVFFALHFFIYTYLIYKLCSWWASTKVAICTLILSIALWADPRMNPILLASQGFSEVLLLTYVTNFFFFYSLYLHIRSTKAKVFCLSVCLISICLAVSAKPQAEPFIYIALIAGSISALFTKLRAQFFTFIALAATCYFIYPYTIPALPFMSDAATQEGSGTIGLHSTLGIVLNLEIRLRVLTYLLIECWPALLSLVAIIFILLARRDKVKKKYLPIIIAYFFFILSWSSWFLLLSIDFPRYFAVPANLCIPIFALFLQYVYSSERGNNTIQDIRALFRGIPTKKKTFILIFAALFTAQITKSLVQIPLFICNHRNFNEHLISMADFINKTVPENSAIETYDAEIFYLLHIPYTYPPDQFNVESIRNNPQAAEANYLSTLNRNSPEYILDGPWSSHAFHVYDKILGSKPYELTKQYGPFKLYKLSEHAN